MYPGPFPMDILVRTPAEIDLALRTGDFFIQEIMKQGACCMSEISDHRACYELCCNYGPVQPPRRALPA